VREINVSCAGDPVHAGDKALRGRVNRYGLIMCKYQYIYIGIDFLSSINIICG
jgi:hypothetical protein